MARYLLALSLGVILSACSEPPAEPQPTPRLVKAMQVSSQTMRTSWVPGQAVASREVELSFRVGGRMTQRLVVVGDSVDEKQIVARLDPADFELELKNAEGRLENAQANFRAAEAEYQRLLNIRRRNPGAISPTQVDRGREERDQAQANIKSFQADVETARLRLKRTELYAPFEGVVVNRYVDAFEDVQPKQPIFRILGTKQIEIKIQLAEDQVRLLREIGSYRVRFDAIPGREFAATLKEVAVEANPTTRTFPVRLILDQPEGTPILPGMAGQVSGEFMAENQPDQLLVPLSATLTEERGTDAPAKDRPTFVYVIDRQTNTLEKRQVVTGKVNQFGVAVTEGLEVGEWIVAAGVTLLEEGQVVRVAQPRRDDSQPDPFGP